MSSVTKATNARVTPGEPILICYDDSPDAVRAIEAAAALLGPRRAVIVDVLPWMTPAEAWPRPRPSCPAMPLRR